MRVQEEEGEQLRRKVGKGSRRWEAEKDKKRTEDEQMRRERREEKKGGK